MELWKFDGQRALLALDMNPGPASSRPDQLQVFSGAVYFRATKDDKSWGIWRFDGSELLQIATGKSVLYGVYDGLLHFILERPDTGYEPWIFDGEKTTFVGDIFPGSESSFASARASFRGETLYLVDEPDRTTDLWKLTFNPQQSPP